MAIQWRNNKFRTVNCIACAIDVKTIRIVCFGFHDLNVVVPTGGLLLSETNSWAHTKLVLIQKYGFFDFTPNVCVEIHSLIPENDSGSKFSYLFSVNRSRELWYLIGPKARTQKSEDGMLSANTLRILLKRVVGVTWGSQSISLLKNSIIGGGSVNDLFPRNCEKPS